MANLNDVVRHVILRILVDADNLGPDMAKARGQLKSLEDSEKEANKRRVKSWEEISKAAKKYTDSLKENQDLTEKSADKAEKSARKTAKAHQEAAAAAERETKALRERAATQAKIERDDANALNARANARERNAAQIRRADENAANARLQTERRTNAQIERADNQAASDRVRRDMAAAQKRTLTFVAAEQARVIAATRAQTAIERAEQTHQERLRGIRDENNDASSQRAATWMDRVNTDLARNASARQIAEANAGTANNRRAVSTANVGVANARLDMAQLRTAAAHEKEISDQQDRQVKSSALIAAAKKQHEILTARAAIAAANQAAAEERAARAAERPVRRMRMERTRLSAVSFLEGSAEPLAARDRRLDAAQIGVDTFGPRAETPFRRFFQNLREDASRSGASVSESLSRIRNGVKKVFADAGDLRGSGGRSGGMGLLGAGAAGLTEFADKLTAKGGPLLDFLFSFRGMIVALLTALGPLAAMLGAVGAAALGLASNIAALSGILFALPGLIGSLVAGFGALALVMKPISGVFQAYSAAQKAAATASVDGGRQAKQAANAYRDAQRAVQDAQIAYDRAVQDQPRSQRRLADAYKDARRQIEDYRLELQRLKYDQENAALGVENAEQAYRRALADPTSNALARKTARMGVVNSLFDQQEANVRGSRLQEDANQAFARGVEGSDQVIDARRAVEDSTRSLEDATVKLARSQDDLNEKYKDYVAGSATARQAQDVLEGQLAGLGPKTRTVVEAILKLGDSWEAMRKRVSDRLFGHLADDTEKFADVIGVLESFLGPAADALGYLAEQALNLFTNPDWKDFFSRQGEESAYIIRTLGDALLSTADGFRGLTEAARPFTRYVVGAIKGMAESFDAFATSEQGREKVANFLSLTRRRMQEIWPILKNLAAGFAGFFTALNTPLGNGEDDFTTKINKGLLGMSETFRDLGEKASDPNGGFMKWLKAVGPLIKDTVGFLGDLSRFLGGLFADQRNLDEAHAIFQSLGKELLPALRDIFSELAESGLISKVVSGIASLLDAFSDFLNSGGTTALGVFASALEGVGKAIDFISENVPGATAAIGALATALALFAGGALFLKLTGMVNLFKSLRYVLNGLKDGGLGGLRDKITDSIAGRDQGETSANRSRTGRGPTPTGGGVLPTLHRIEGHLKTIIRLLGGRPGVGIDTDGPDRDRDGRRTEGGRHRAPEGRTGRGGRLGRLLGGADDAGFVEPGRFLPGGRRGATEAVEEVAERAASRGGMRGAMGGLGRFGGTLARGLAGGIGGAVAGLALSYGGDALINRYVRNDRDAGSLSRAMGAVGTGAGIGGLVGSVVPVVGTGIGAGIGAVAGGAYSLARDPNLRRYLGDKIGDAGRSLGGAITGRDTQGNQISMGERLRTGAAALSPAAGLLGATDIGKNVTDSLSRAGSAVARFFTRTIPDAASRGLRAVSRFFTQTIPDAISDHLIKPLSRFFTRTLPSLPGRFFDAFTTGAGVIFGFFAYRLPREIRRLFTQTIPRMAATAWEWVQTNLFAPMGVFITETIPNFFTETIPHWFDNAITYFGGVVDNIRTFVTETIPAFFTETIPKWFAAAPEWFRTNVTQPITDFFTVTLPNFFTTTLPNAISSLPGVLYDNLVSPVLTFFRELGSHIGDAISGSWDWATSLFSRGSKNFEQGAASQKMSGGLIEGIYTGVEDGVRLYATPEEFVVRRSKVLQPGGKAFLRDFNEGRINVEQIYAGLAAAASPQVMTLMPPTATAMSTAMGATTAIDNSRGFSVGDITINNPVRERSDRSLRRTLQIAAIRHRL